MASMLEIFLDLLFPRRSLRGEFGAWITLAERSQLQPRPLIQDRAALRRRGIQALDRLVSAHPYHESLLLQRAIHTFKYKRIPGFAEDLALLILRSLPSDSHAMRERVLCPVPLHWSRMFHRGFNQAELLSRVLAEELDIEHRQILRRCRATGHQAWRGRSDRLHALSHAFALRGTIPRHVVLIDDLSTTGATLDECAAVLKVGGAKWVEGWVIAHG